MVGGRDDCEAHHHRPQRRNASKDQMRAVPQQAEADKQRVCEVQRRHGRDGELEFILGPCCTLAAVVEDIEEAELLR